MVWKPTLNKNLDASSVLNMASCSASGDWNQTEQFLSSHFTFKTSVSVFDNKYFKFFFSLFLFSFLVWFYCPLLPAEPSKWVEWKQKSCGAITLPFQSRTPVSHIIYSWWSGSCSSIESERASKTLKLLTNCRIQKVSGYMYFSHAMRKPVFAICEQQRRRSACAFAQSDQRLSCSLPG